MLNQTWLNRPRLLLVVLKDRTGPTIGKCIVRLYKDMVYLNGEIFFH